MRKSLPSSFVIGKCDQHARRGAKPVETTSLQREQLGGGDEDPLPGPVYPGATSSRVKAPSLTAAGVTAL